MRFCELRSFTANTPRSRIANAALSTMRGMGGIRRMSVSGALIAFAVLDTVTLNA
jgi:hypothetical protein